MLIDNVDQCLIISEEKKSDDSAFHGPMNADLKQLGKALKRQCLNDTRYVAIGHNTNVYQKQHPTQGTRGIGIPF